MSENSSDEFLKNLPVQTENIAFKAEEMISCEKCGRPNPPNRLECVYCGAKLEISAEQSHLLKLNLRKLEAWEKGFNLIFIPEASDEENLNAATVSRLLKSETETIDKIFAAKIALPIARAESEKEAEIVQQRLRETGVETRIVNDKNLAVEKTPRRLRGIEFDENNVILILFNQDEIVSVPNEDIILIVTGAIFERKIQATETYNKKGENKILDSTETASDDLLIDIYSREDFIGYRVWAKGFDFSCLENEKKILATENIKTLAERLRQAFPDAKFVDDYRRIRASLSEVWEVEQKTASQGLQRKSFGKFNMGNLTTINNLSQFTKYSRLQRHLI